MMPEKGRYILDHADEIVYLGSPRYNFGWAKAYVAKFKNRFWYLEDDGTGNAFFGGGKVKELKDKKAVIKTLLKWFNYKKVPDKAQELGLEVTEEELEEVLFENM